MFVDTVTMSVAQAGDATVEANVTERALALVGGDAHPMFATLLLADRLTRAVNTEIKFKNSRLQLREMVLARTVLNSGHFLWSAKRTSSSSFQV